MVSVTPLREESSCEADVAKSREVEIAYTSTLSQDKAEDSITARRTVL
jgi:hypothetical protein